MNRSRSLRLAGATALTIGFTAASTACRGAIGVDDLEFDRCQTLYVSPTGDDTNEGCSTAAPMKTIQAAIAAAKTRKIVGGSIEICAKAAGTAYVGPITLDYPISLLGDFICDSWMRPKGYGYPVFEQGNNTLLVPKEGTSNSPTLLVVGPSIDESVLLDGLYVYGPEKSTSVSNALVITESASPHAENLFILGGGTAPDAEQGSAGLIISSDARPKVEMSVIFGGHGQTKTDIGSVALYMSSNGSVKNCGLEAGSGTSDKGIGSLGAYLECSNLTGDATFQYNQINGGRGSSQVVESAVGIYVAANGEVDLLDNEISVFPGSHGPTMGIEVLSGNVHIERSRIAAGMATSSIVMPTYTRGILAYAGTVTILNNMIFGGGGKSNLTLDTGGIEGDSADMTIWNNTILMGLHQKEDSAGIDLYGGTADVRNNLILASQEGSQIGIVVPPSLHALHVFENNVVYVPDEKYSAILLAAAGKNGKPFTTMTAVENAITGAGEMAKGNFVIASACGTTRCACDDMSCLVVPACTTADACASALFASWDQSDGTTTLLKANGGWRLSPKAPPTLREGGADLTRSDPPVTVDLYGRPRTVPLSIGAHECDANSCD